VAVRTALLSLALATISAIGAGFQPEDLAAWRAAGEPRISPDGRWLAYLEKRLFIANVKLIAVQGADGKQGTAQVPGATEGLWRDGSPRWSPDSTRLAWLSDRDGTVRIHILGMASGTETTLETLPRDGPHAPLAFAWAPEGDALAYTARAPSSSAPPPWAPPALLPRLVRPAEPIQLFLLPSPGARPRQLSTGDFDCDGEPAWMPDGQTILAARAGGQIHAFRLSGGVKPLTRHPGRNESPLPSPDGSKIAWLATEAQPAGYAIRKLTVMNADGSRVKVLTGALDRDAAAPQWSSDSRTVYFLADDRGATHVYAARADGTVRQATSAPERLGGFSLADNRVAATIRSTAASGEEVVVFPIDQPAGARVVASPNRALLADRQAAAVEEIDSPSEGHTIQAWLTKPPGFDPAKKYPLLLEILDDPRAMCGGQFDLRHQVLAARGFVVLCANPRGTPGYGEEFGNLLRTRFPGDDFDDLMRAVDRAVAKGFVDPRRLNVVGGLLAAWALGHTTRFAAVVAKNPIVDWTLEAARDAEAARRVAAWMGAWPWDDPDQYVKHSPIYFAQNFKTRTLVIAADGDPQAEELDSALRARGVESARVRMSGDAVLEMEAILAWLR